MGDLSESYKQKLKKMNENKKKFDSDVKLLQTSRIEHDAFVQNLLHPIKSELIHPFNNKLSSFYR